jgi:hypothetical protein
MPNLLPLFSPHERALTDGTDLGGQLGFFLHRPIDIIVRPEKLD